MGELGRRVKQARNFRRLTLHALARQAGVGVQTLVRIEEGHPNVGMLNLFKVLQVLGVSQSPVPQQLSRLSQSAALPRTALHASSRATQLAAAQAATEAVASLQGWLDENAAPARVSLGAAVKEQLAAHLVDLLTAQGAAAGPVLYADSQVGGPLQADEQCSGWVLHVRDTRTVLQHDAVVQLPHPRLKLHASRQAALQGLRRFIEVHGHVPGPVDALPAQVDAQGHCTF